ncbi:AVN_HP_G0073940.mRNA.1.CDS.1 [Saccharomyces cerevisiae]|nr:AVN_HP_G0073940.mRNA.1.CDS.1 [Saccharomyces cerevisiae]CAI6951019.1 AVN_HP_G0073940.mRNA.1.CDS.1 [Saccharomyces cerevisiae]
MSDIYMSNRLSKVFTLIAASIGREIVKLPMPCRQKKPLKNRWENGLARLSDLRAWTLKAA